MNNRIVIMGLFLFAGCITRAPTTYELDRRAGFTTPGEPTIPDELTKMRANANINKNPIVPARVPSLVEKIWINDQILADGAKMQGTWLFLEVEPGRWVDDVDSSAPSLILNKK